MRMRTERQNHAIRRRLGVLATCVALMGASTALTSEAVSDSAITSAINTEYWVDSAVPANQIDVSTQEGIVTLSGSAGSILAKERAQAHAEATVGVRAVVNRINVQPAVIRTDKELIRAIEQAWTADPATEDYEVTASAKEGVVTLTGTVDSYAEKGLCATVAKGVSGVKDIENDITVDYKTARSDYEIQQEIEARLKNDVRVDDYLITVNVTEGDVTLSGSIGSLQEKRQAKADAWVAGVKSVNGEELEIRWWAREEMRRKSAYVSRTDEEIEQAVKDAFLYDPRVWSSQPNVEVSYGTVTLTGVVDNLAAKEAAEDDARSTVGVWRVVNHLKVRPEIPSNDELESRVSAALMRDPYVERYAVSLETYNGWVYLSGKVNTSFEKNQAEDVAQRVKGVVDVVNNIDFDYEWTWKPDWEIREDVKSQFAWSPFVDGDDISVSVDNGVVTLIGTVDTWSERQDAEENAYEGGAKDVQNNLSVAYRYYGPSGPSYYGPYSFFRPPN